MELMTPEMKVCDVIREQPATVDVFLDHGCPDMRNGFFNVMSRLMSVRNAARIHRLPLEELLADFNRASHTDPTSTLDRDSRPPFAAGDDQKPA